MVATDELGREEGTTVAWIGHSTVYVRIHNLGIITDPVFSEQVGVGVRPVFVGPRRYTPPAARPETFSGLINLVLLSHAHLDHLDKPSLKRLAAPSVTAITAEGTGKLIRRYPFQQVLELGGRNQIKLDCGVTVTAVPVKHWGRRFPWNRDYGWTGYLVEYEGVRCFFAGDTAYVEHFTELADAAAETQIDVAIIPIGAYSPDPFQGSHCTPEQAWQMFLDTGARWLVPVHWNTFVLSQEPVDEPLKRLLSVAGDQADRIVIRQQGDVFHFG